MVAFGPNKEIMNTEFGWNGMKLKKNKKHTHAACRLKTHSSREFHSSTQIRRTVGETTA